MNSFDIISLILAWAGCSILFWRLIPRQKSSSQQITDRHSWSKVSIVIPARNEEKNLPILLKSLKNLDYPDYEIIVVDDNSTDQTREIAESFGITVLQGAAPPNGWNGKNWACHQAVPHLKGDIFLFTDADTHHFKDGLKRSVAFFLESKLDMMSALPYHRVEKWWEKLMGPFHTILLAATAPYAPKPKRLFAIGQYLMFSRESYEKQKGHKAVFNQYPDDLALANACLDSGGSFQIFMGRPLFNVRMYISFKEFILGWRRNFLAGIQQSNWGATLEVTLIFWGLLGGGNLLTHAIFWPPALLSIFLIAFYQRRWGRFSFSGILFIPVSLFLFCLITFLSSVDYLTGNVLRWKGRSYTRWVKRSET